MEQFLAFDVETGGLDPEKTSLLTAYFAVLDENFNALEELDLKIRNDNENEIYHVSAKALEINKINLVALQKEGVSKDVAKLKLVDLINKYSEGGKAKLKPLGHNVGFDIGFVKTHLIPEHIWRQYVDYHLADTASFAELLKIQKKIPRNVSSRLESLCKFFNIDTTRGEVHSSKFDTILAVALLQAMSQL